MSSDFEEYYHEEMERRKKEVKEHFAKEHGEYVSDETAEGIVHEGSKAGYWKRSK